MFWTLPKGLPREAYQLGPLVARFRSPKFWALVAILALVLLGISLVALGVGYSQTEDVWLIATFGGYGGVIGLIVLGGLVGVLIPWIVFMNVWVYGERRVYVCEQGLVQTQGPIGNWPHFYGERFAKVCRWDQITEVRQATRAVQPGSFKAFWHELLWGSKGRKTSDSPAVITPGYGTEVWAVSLVAGDQVVMTLNRGDVAGFDRLVEMVQAKTARVA
jgi:hypothetical protein